MLKLKLGNPNSEGGRKMTKNVFDYSKLKGRIKEKFNNQRDFAKALCISEVALTNKLNNRTKFNQDEILKCIDLLVIDLEEIPLYFFTI